MQPAIGCQEMPMRDELVVPVFHVLGPPLVPGKAHAVRSRPPWLVAIVFLLALPLPCWGQSGAVKLLESFVPSLPIPAMRPHRVAVDGSGNVYIADVVENKVVELPAAGGLAVTVPLSGLKGADGIAADGLGNLYIGDYGSGTVVELSAKGVQTTLKNGMGLTGLNVAVDGAGNLFVSDSGNNQVLEMPSGENTWTVVPATGLKNPLGLATDGTGNLYIADYGNSRIVKLSWTQQAWGAQTTVGTGLSGPEDVKVDSQGNVFICDTGNDQVILAPATGAAQSQVEQGGNPVGLAVGQGGDVFVATTNGNQLSLLNFSSGSFAGMAVGQSQTATAIFKFSSTTTLASIAASTQGASGLAFATASGGSCATGVSYAPGALCSVVVTFAPTASGAQTGSLTLVANGGGDAAQVFLSGLGTGPGLAFNPGAVSTLGVTGLASPAGTAVDASGDVFAADNANKRVVELPGGGGAQTTVGSGLAGPSAVAVDGAGNIYIADSAGNKVDELPAGTTSQIVVGSGFTAPSGLAADSYGNVFVADSGNNRVVELPANGATSIAIGADLIEPAGVAVDGLGNIYIADTGNDRVVEIAVNGGAQSVIGTGLAGPRGVAVDAALNVYIADTGNSRVVMAPAGGAAQTTLLGGLKQPQGLSIDSSGNIYIADTGNKRLLKIGRAGSTALALSFASTTAGSRSGDSPKDEFVQNIGTQPLVFAANGVVLSDEVDFGIDLGAETDYCQADTNLNPGASCLVESTFIPAKAGSLTATITLTDNALNANAAEQTIKLSGMALAAQTIDFAQPASPVVYGISPIKLVATASSGLAVAWSVTGPGTLSGSELKITGAGAVVVTASQPGSSKYGAAASVSRTIEIAKAVLTVTAVNVSRAYREPTPEFTARIAGYVNGDGAKAVTGSPELSTDAAVNTYVGAYPIYVARGTLAAANYSFRPIYGVLTIVQAKPLIVWASPASIIYGKALGAAELDAISKVEGKFTYSPASGAILKAGLQELSASFAPTDTRNYLPASAAVRLTVEPAPLIVTASSVSVVYGHALPALAYGVTGFAGGDTRAVLKGAPVEATTAAKGSVPGVYPISIKQGTLAAANYVFAFKNGALTITPAGKTATPVFKPASGTSSTPLVVTIADTTPGAVVYYTTNQTAPTASSTRYTAAGIRVAVTETIEAAAIAPGYTLSAVTSSKYTIALPPAVSSPGR